MPQRLAKASALISLEFGIGKRSPSFKIIFPVCSGALRREIEDLALRSYLALECRDAGRVDVKLDRDNRPAFLELNALPGLHPTHSDLPMIATQKGMKYRDLIGAIVKSALERAATG